MSSSLNAVLAKKSEYSCRASCTQVTCHLIRSCKCEGCQSMDSSQCLMSRGFPSMTCEHTLNQSPDTRTSPATLRCFPISSCQPMGFHSLTSNHCFQVTSPVCLTILLIQTLIMAIISASSALNTAFRFQRVRRVINRMSTNRSKESC